MFTWLNEQGVQSDKGFIVQTTSRFTAEYRENGRVITVDIEYGRFGGKPCVMIGRDAFRRWDNDSVPLSEEEKRRVLGNFRDACEFKGLLVVESWSSPAQSSMWYGTDIRKNLLQ